MKCLGDGHWTTDVYAYLPRIALGLPAALQGPAETPLASKGSQRLECPGTP